MPNALAYLALFCWPLAVLALFRRLPPPAALVWSVLGGYLLLPIGVGIDLPLLPAIEKTLVPSLAAAVMCLSLPRAGQAGSPPGGTAGAPSGGNAVVLGLLVLALAAPVLTMLENRDPVPAGPRLLPGIRVYDIFSMISGTLVTLLPFLLARRFLATPQSHATLLRAFCLAGLGYSVLCLIEVRLSPQLNVWLYGYFPHSFAQQMRAGGFRPVVFLGHGLSVGMFMAMTVLAAAALWRHHRRNPGGTAAGEKTAGEKAEGQKAGLWLAAMLWLLGTLVLVKASGALAITLALLPVVLLAGVRVQMILAAVLALTVLFYPLLRGAGLVPVDRIHAVALSFSAERADSLKYRLDNEDMLLARANERPLAGWGGWGRARIYHPETGRDLSVTDGVWIIVIGNSGWLGYLAQFGLLTVPILLLALRQRRLGLSPATAGLALVMAANLTDLLPNASLTPLTWLVAGAMMGRAGLRAADDAALPAAAVPDGAPALAPPAPAAMVRRPRAGPGPPAADGAQALRPPQAVSGPPARTHRRQPRR